MNSELSRQIFKKY